MEKRGVIDEKNTPPEQKCCGGNKCASQQTQKEAADKLEDGVTTRAAKHVEEKSQ